MRIFFIDNNDHISYFSYDQLTNYTSQIYINEINQFEQHMNHNANTYEL